MPTPGSIGAKSRTRKEQLEVATHPSTSHVSLGSDPGMLHVAFLYTHELYVTNLSTFLALVSARWNHRRTHPSIRSDKFGMVFTSHRDGMTYFGRLSFYLESFAHDSTSAMQGES